MLKQRQVEELLLQNRIKKLHHEESAFKKQIKVAENHTRFAQTVQFRRAEDRQMRSEQRNIWEEFTYSQNAVFNQRREENREIIQNQKQTKFTRNCEIVRDIRQEAKRHFSTIASAKMEEISNKKVNWTGKYEAKKAVAIRSRYSKEEYLDSVAASNMQKAINTIKLKEQHEEALKKLETIESNAINSLSQTIAAKNAAITNLNTMSPGLRRSMQPRRAYKFRQSQPEMTINVGYPTSEKEIGQNYKFASEKDAQEE